MHLARLRVYVDGTRRAADTTTLVSIFVKKYLDADYRDATVIDIGAHKGYFSAFALTRGARRVLSYEPDRDNFAYLDRSRATCDLDWHAHRAAVGAATRTAALAIDRSSTSHSLVQAEAQVRLDPVDVVPLSAVIEEALRAGGRRLIVKVNAEGSECEIVLATPIETWQAVSEAFVQVHSFAPCTRDEIVTHLARAGLEVVPGLAHIHVVRAERPQTIGSD